MTKRIIIAIAIVLVTAIVFFAFKSHDSNPTPLEWKKAQYGAICENAMKGEGLSTDTTEYGVCTRDLGYKIKAIQPTPTSEPTSEPSTAPTSETPTQPEPENPHKVACASLRAITLDDLIASNKKNGISEEDTRITYKAGIAQCESENL